MLLCNLMQRLHRFLRIRRRLRILNFILANTRSNFLQVHKLDMLLVPINISIINRIYINRAIAYYSLRIIIHIYFVVHKTWYESQLRLIWVGNEDCCMASLCCEYWFYETENLWLRIVRYSRSILLIINICQYFTSRKSMPFKKIKSPFCHENHWKNAL